MKRLAFATLATVGVTVLVGQNSLFAQSSLDKVRTYAAGGLQIESVNPSSGKVDYRLRTVNNIVPSADRTLESTMIDSRGETFYTSSVAKSWQAWPGSLDCSNPNDICLRCFYVNNRDSLAERRIDSFANADDGFD